MHAIFLITLGSQISVYYDPCFNRINFTVIPSYKFVVISSYIELPQDNKYFTGSLQCFKCRFNIETVREKWFVVELLLIWLVSEAASRGALEKGLEACKFVKKKTPTEVFYFEFCEILKNTFFTEHFWVNPSRLLRKVKSYISSFRKVF